MIGALLSLLGWEAEAAIFVLFVVLAIALTRPRRP